MKIIPPEAKAEKPAGRFSRAQMQREMARQAAVGKSLAKYIRMKCGHMSDIETQHVYAVFRPKGASVYCETCDKWTAAVIRPQAAPEYPQTPLF